MGSDQQKRNTVVAWFTPIGPDDGGGRRRRIARGRALAHSADGVRDGGGRAARAGGVRAVRAADADEVALRGGS